jgi:hypothetical protein
MTLRIISADQRLAEACGKTTMAVFGPSGSGKTWQLKTLPSKETLCVDLEAGMKSVQDWPGDSIPVRTFADAIDIACLIGGVNPAADEKTVFCEGHYRHLAQTYPDLVQMIATKSIIFVDSITDLSTALRNPLRIFASQRLIFLHFDLKFYLGVLLLFWRDSNDKCSIDDEPRHG